MRLAPRLAPRLAVRLAITMLAAAGAAPARLHAQDSTHVAVPAPPTAAAGATVAAASAPTGSATASGVVEPGMSEAQVRAAWGAPLAVRTLGAHTYMYFRNGCPTTRCGMNDVVILERGQVVDAVVRASDHRYGGVSSSPAARAPAPSVDSDSGRTGP
jgi:hypothetical protein